MNNRIIQMLGQTSAPGLIDSIEKTYASADEPGAGDDNEHAENAAKALAKQAKITKLSNAALCELSDSCIRPSIPQSSRILLCGSKSQIQDLQPGDTVITLDGVWQVHDDFQVQTILSSKEMGAAIPAELQPQPGSTLTIIKLNDDPTEQSQKLTGALNKALLKKENSLYVSRPESEALQHVESVIRILRTQHLEKEIAHRKLSNNIFKLLKIKNGIQLQVLAKRIAQECGEYYQKRGTAVFAADELSSYIIDKLAKKINLRTWSVQELKILSSACFAYQPQISPRIINAGSKEMLNDSDVVSLQAGDTIILPDGVRQIDHAGTFHQILDAKQMRKPIPSSMIPTATSPITTILCNNTAALNPDSADGLLINALNNAFIDSSNAMYLGDESADASLIMNLLSGVAQITNEEIHRRHLKTNLIFKALGVKSDAEFLNYFLERLYPGKIEPPKLNTHIADILQNSKRINLTNFTDTELRDLCDQCENWVPKVSPRILVAHTFPDDYQINDTIILPNGIYQMRIDPSSGKIQQEKLVDQTTLDTLDINDYFPDSSKSVHIFDDYNQESVQQIARLLNPIILKNPKGMYLYEIPSRESESYGAVKTVLKKMAKQALGARALHHFKSSQPQKSRFNFSGFSLFRSGKTVAPEVISTPSEALNPEGSVQIQSELPRAKMNRKQLFAGAQRLKSLQQKLRNPSPLAQQVAPSTTTMLLQSQDLSDVQRTIHEVHSAIDEISIELGHTLSINFSTEMSLDQKSVQILQGKSLFLEASNDTVAMHKPLLKAQINNEAKAELFLQALGIPPTEGKRKVEVRGGNHALRKAVRELFQTFKAQEHLQKKADPSDSDQETIASSQHNL